MTDFHALLPNFPHVERYGALLAGMETHRIGLSELLTLDAAEIGKRTRLPLLDVQRFSEDVRRHLGAEKENGSKRETEIQTISTLDDHLDRILHGGFPVGCVSEIVGESGVGKTQLLLSLLLAVQLPPAQGGLGRKALYIATEAPLATGRLTQMMRSRPKTVSSCSLAHIATINTPDLEAQDHILTHQLPVQLAHARGAFGLVVIDSVAANYRSFFGGGGGGGGGAGASVGGTTGGGGSLADRSRELARLGMLLRTLAQKHNVAIVVANQVADRFDEDEDARVSLRGSSQIRGGSQSQHLSLPSQPGPSQQQQPPSSFPLSSSLPFDTPPPPPVLRLDHQQRWFTGWGDEADTRIVSGRNKTPSLGLVWATQLGMRVALIKAPRIGRRRAGEEQDEEEDDEKVGAPRLRHSWRRWLKVVFAPHAEGAIHEFDITMKGLEAVVVVPKK